MNGLNYTYLECLHLGIPLVHNSKYIQDAGFYYSGYDIHAGADQVENMITTYDRDYDKHMKKNKEVLFRYSPENERYYLLTNNDFNINISKKELVKSLKNIKFSNYLYLFLK